MAVGNARAILRHRAARLDRHNFAGLDPLRRLGAPVLNPPRQFLLAPKLDHRYHTPCGKKPQ